MSEQSRPILVAIDFSDDSDAAANWGVKQASALKAPLCFIHVVHEPSNRPGFYHENPADVARSMSEVAKEMLDKYLASLIARHPDIKAISDANIILVRGLPPTRIIEAARKVNASQIIMGCRGLTGISHLMLGSQTERVIQLSEVPVTAIKAEAKSGASENE